MLLFPDDRICLSASDVTDFLACGHLAAQKLAIARGERARPRPEDDPHTELIRRRGDEHEREQLARLSEACGACVDLTRDRSPGTPEALRDAAEATAAAMRDGAPLIFQATLFDGRWQGRIDFLRRVAIPSDLGPFAYELLDTKLARQVKPGAVHQLSLYSRLLSQVQGVELPEAWIVLGDGTEARVDLTRYAALHRRVARRVEALVEGATPATVPEPVSHCDICDLERECREWLVATDHLSLVAGARRDQRDKLVGAGVETLAGLATLPGDVRVPKLSPERLATLRGQAGLQLRSRLEGRPTREHLSPEPARGYARLPEPDAGDLFFDLEGDPYAGADGGLEYLWGWCDAGGEYDCVWAHDAHAERAALERFVDFVLARRRSHPAMHVYHYAPHEASTLQGLALKHATREDEVDSLLKESVLVDLFAVVRQGVQVGEESYSLKRLERHHRFERLERSVREGGGSIVAYERWLESGDGTQLEAIRAYNEEDCRSTLSLRDWVWRELRPEAAARFGVDFADLADPEPSEPPAPPAWLEEIEPIEQALTAPLPADPDADDADQAERRLLAQLLRYHQREGKPQWWRHFALRAMTPQELVDEPDAIGLLRRDDAVAPTPHRRSLDYRFTFPAQEQRLKPGTVIEPATDESHKLIEAGDGHVVLRRASAKPAPAPAALIPSKPVDPRVLRRAIAAVGESLIAGEDSFAAVRSLLRREPPTLPGGMPDDDLEALRCATLELAATGGHLAIQGPPGTGKTYRGARMIAAALERGLRVAITAPSHAAIQNLVRAVEDHAAAAGVSFRGVYKGDGYASATGAIEVVDRPRDADAGYDLVAGTAWLLARPEHREAIDLLFADEAGQLALADLVAAGTCARGLVLLGDPQQLPQVTQAQHPGAAGNSALGHLLAGADTIPPERGVLLTESWRMHPDVCAFVSERSYERRLRSRPACATRRVDAAAGMLRGAGLRTIPVAHAGRSQSSEEEAAAIAAACRDLLAGGTVTDEHGAVRPLRPDDIMVVAPYNLAVHCIAAAVPAGVQVGTVDRFQGREAPIVFFAMTCSSGHDVPRGLDFLFSRNRLNVAISRAQCLAVLVHSPALLDADCRTLQAMELVDGVCRFVEMAEGTDA
ncbi:TM0106 family RecB-like putative nuclease [Conexibacter arvalis]|uniref:Uncharacterized protein n=1 Tax=Conexibacter arvalis TaxID=912552 RepID=A0A840IKN1_9ACTN|nr:TM0106 family RecB-like putative nuclease [Conexibacter arvalis]MBB4664791.1 uncharacterized protein [Conexibacter arvalis]